MTIDWSIAIFITVTVIVSIEVVKRYIIKEDSPVRTLCEINACKGLAADQRDVDALRERVNALEAERRQMQREAASFMSGLKERLDSHTVQIVEIQQAMLRREKGDA